MNLFFRKRKNRVTPEVKEDVNINVNNVYVVTTKIISSFDDGSYNGPMSTTFFFLAKLNEDDGEYYELFTETKLEKKSEERSFSKKLDTPYVEKAEPLTEYLRNPEEVLIAKKELFMFITQMNVQSKLEAISKKGKASQK